jgi:protein farnesyltransferase subunit beta
MAKNDAGSLGSPSTLAADLGHGLPDAGGALRSSTAAIPNMFTSFPPIQDILKTETSTAQEHTVNACLPYLAKADEDGRLPDLRREEHVDFLRYSLEEMPSNFVGYDAARPWVVYWALTGLSLLGADVSEYQHR